MAVVQTVKNTSASVSALSASYTAPTSGHICVIGATMGTGARTPVSPSGSWNLAQNGTDSLFSGAAFYESSGGADTSFSSSYAAGGSSTFNLIFLEFDDAVTITGVLSAEDTTNLATTVTAQGSGSITTSGGGLLVAIIMGDNYAGLGAGGTWSNSFTAITDFDSTNAARGGVFIASRTVAAAGTYSTTYTGTGAGTHAYGVLMFFPSAGGGGTTVSPSTGINDAQGNTPTIGLQKTARPIAGINNIVGVVPTISFGSATTVSPLAGINNVVGQVPTIGKQKTFSPSTGNVRNVGNTPTITWQLTILAATSANHIIGNAPSITFGALAAITVSPATGNVSNYGSTPLIQTGIWTPVQLNTSFWTPDTDQSSTWTANIPASTVWS